MTLARASNEGCRRKYFSHLLIQERGSLPSNFGKSTFGGLYTGLLKVDLGLEFVVGVTTVEYWG